MYELAIGKKRYAQFNRTNVVCSFHPVNWTKEKTESIPTIQPFTAKELNGIKGRSTGVRSAPAITATNPRPRKSTPPLQASLKKMPDGCSPKAMSIRSANHPYHFNAGLISIGVSTSLSRNGKLTVRIARVALYPE